MYRFTAVGSSQSRGRILVVDQDDWCREFLSQVIKLGDFGEFYLASSVEEAEALSEKLSFDLLIIDPNLPQCQQWLDDMRQRFPGLRFIIMLQQRGQIQQIYHLEHLEIVIKPLGLDEMARKIREAIQAKHRIRTEETIIRLKMETFRF
ncbi:MAG: response regulator [Thermodesulfobacteriota bacterium]